MFIELLSNYGLFLLKTLTVVISIVLILSFIMSTRNNKTEGDIAIKNINEEFSLLEENIKKNLLGKSEFKKFIKLRKKDKKIEKDFNENQIKSENFAKKTLGQIVFLFFLQRKGWLGIERNENKNFKK